MALLAKAAHLQPITGPARIVFNWRERDRRRDPDGFTSAGKKLILDGLVTAGVLADDGWDEIAEWRDLWSVSSDPGVLVTISEIGDAWLPR